MDAVQLAYLEVALARATMRAHLDIEAQVAHWLLEGKARPQEFAEARKRLRDAKQAHARAKAAYAALATQRAATGNPRRGFLHPRRGANITGRKCRRDPRPLEPLWRRTGPTGRPATSSTGTLNVNLGADPYLTLDPTVNVPQGGAQPAGQGVNQMAGFVADQNGAVLPLYAELAAVPLTRDRPQAKEHATCRARMAGDLTCRSCPKM